MKRGRSAEEKSDEGCRKSESKYEGGKKSGRKEKAEGKGKQEKRGRRKANI